MFRLILKETLRNGPVALLVFTSATLLYLYLSVGKYLSYNAYALDLGLFAQSSWLISHFKVPYSTLIGRNQFADHFSPVYIVLSLGYRFFNSPIYLLVLQITSVVLGGIPVYLICRSVLKSTGVASLLTIAYFLQIGLISAINFDFHLATLSVGFISWTLYFWYTKRKRLYLVLLVLSLLVKEDVSILFIFFSVYLFLRKDKQLAITTVSLSLFWYLTYTKLIIPHFLGKDYYLSQIDVVAMFSGLGEKSKTVIKTFGQNLGLSLLSPLSWFFSTPNLLSRFLSPAANRWSTDWHYGANLAAPLSIATIFGLAKFRNDRVIETLSVFILLSTVFISWPIRPSFKPRYIDSYTLDKVVNLIPSNASVSAQDVFVPHLANREKIYLFPTNPDADYVILAKNLPSFPLDEDGFREKLKEMYANTKYVARYYDGVVVFNRLEQQ